jgi:serine/threonine-protein kinase RsbW
MATLIREQDTDDGINRVKLIGRLHIQGMREVDVKFHGATAARGRNTIVDCSKLEYVGSLGMGMFFACARSLQYRQAKMVLLAPPPAVVEAFRRTGVDQATPIVDDEDAARAALGRVTATPRRSLQLEVERTPRCFARLAPALDTFVRDARLEDRAAFVTRLVVEEVVRNLLEHGTGGGGDLWLSIESTSRTVTVVIEGDGDPFDPVDAPALDVDAPLEQRGERGMGLHLLQGMTDRLDYTRADGRNRLTAVIDRHRPPT